jgi:hypothetical protein
MPPPRGREKFRIGTHYFSDTPAAILRRIVNLGTPYIMQAKNWPRDCGWQDYIAPAPTITPGMSVEAIRADKISLRTMQYAV